MYFWVFYILDSKSYKLNLMWLFYLLFKYKCFIFEVFLCFEVNLTFLICRFYRTESDFRFYLHIFPEYFSRIWEDLWSILEKSAMQTAKIGKILFFTIFFCFSMAKSKWSYRFNLMWLLYYYSSLKSMFENAARVTDSAPEKRSVELHRRNFTIVGLKLGSGKKTYAIWRFRVQNQ